jgi:hypothetical protein
MTTTELAPRAAADLDTLPDVEPDTTPALPPGLIAAASNLLGDGVAGIFAAMADGFEHMKWAEQEIAAAQARHPGHADRIWHAFSLLLANPGLQRMAYELVYRAHCREILDRVAAGEDTRPGTAAEVCSAMVNTSLLAPLTSAASGLYLRMWQAAGLPELDEITGASGHHEALERSTIDDHERSARRRLATADRRLGDIACRGLHNSVKVDCSYARTGELAAAAAHNQVTTRPKTSAPAPTGTKPAASTAPPTTAAAPTRTTAITRGGLGVPRRTR